MDVYWGAQSKAIHLILSSTIFPVLTSLLSLTFTPPVVCLNHILKIFYKLDISSSCKFWIRASLLKNSVMMIVTFVKLYTRNTPGFGVILKHCHKAVSLKYVSSLDEPPCGSEVTAFIQSNEIIPFFGRPLKNKRYGYLFF